jgi:hypothetical protein
MHGTDAAADRVGTIICSERYSAPAASPVSATAAYTPVGGIASRASPASAGPPIAASSCTLDEIRFARSS